jgi:hypothetical protein
MTTLDIFALPKQQQQIQKQQQPFASASMLTLKTDFNGDLRRRSLSLESGCLGFGAVGRYEQFQQFICSIYNLENCRFSYLDDDNDRIRINCDEEVQYEQQPFDNSIDVSLNSWWKQCDSSSKLIWDLC